MAATVIQPPVAEPLAAPTVGEAAAALRPGLHKKTAKLMVVDDEPTNVKLVQRFLELEGYERFMTLTDSRRVMDAIRDYQPDCVLLDLMMPYVSGLELLSAIRADAALAVLPVVILTAMSDAQTRRDALERGATDFLNKPVDPYELAPRVANVLAAKSYQDALLTQNNDLEKAVRARTYDLERAQREVAHCLARAAEFRDNDTGFHVMRVGKFARLIAKELGQSDDQADLLELASQLHDVGKIGIPDEVLLKPGRLTPEEFDLIKRHCGFGKHILRQFNPEEDNEPMRRHSEIGASILASGTSPLLGMARRVAISHHEWWNGAGYPLGLAGEDIPLEGRIAAVADVFDALSSKRVYKDSLPLDRCFDMLREERGTHFDPQVVDAFLARREAVVEIQIHYADEM